MVKSLMHVQVLFLLMHFISICSGEFGLVYKAHLLNDTMPDVVAVKTLKGTFLDDIINIMLTRHGFNSIQYI